MAATRKGGETCLDIEMLVSAGLPLDLLRTVQGACHTAAIVLSLRGRLEGRTSRL